MWFPLRNLRWHGEVLQSRVALYFLFPRSSLFLLDDFRFEPTLLSFLAIGRLFFSSSLLHPVTISLAFHSRTNVGASDSLRLTRIHPTAPGSRTVAARYELIGGEKGGTSRLEQDVHHFFFSVQESSVAVVLPQKPGEREETLQLITPTDEKVEVIKVRQLLFGFAWRAQ